MCTGSIQTADSVVAARGLGELSSLTGDRTHVPCFGRRILFFLEGGFLTSRKSLKSLLIVPLYVLSLLWHAFVPLSYPCRERIQMVNGVIVKHHCIIIEMI